MREPVMRPDIILALVAGGALLILVVIWPRAKLLFPHGLKEGQPEPATSAVLQAPYASYRECLDREVGIMDKLRESYVDRQRCYAENHENVEALKTAAKQIRTIERAFGSLSNMCKAETNGALTREGFYDITYVQQ